MVLLGAEGHSNVAVAARVGVAPQTVGKWRRRFMTAGPAGAGSSVTLEAFAAVVREELEDSEVAPSGL